MNGLLFAQIDPMSSIDKLANGGLNWALAAGVVVLGGACYKLWLDARRATDALLQAKDDYAKKVEALLREHGDTMKALLAQLRGGAV